MIGRHGQTQPFSSLLKSNDKNGHMPVLFRPNQSKNETGQSKYKASRKS